MVAINSDIEWGAASRLRDPAVRDQGFAGWSYNGSGRRRDRAKPLVSRFRSSQPPLQHNMCELRVRGTSCPFPRPSDDASHSVRPPRPLIPCRLCSPRSPLTSPRSPATTTSCCATSGAWSTTASPPRPGERVARLTLDRLGVPRAAYDGIVSSGDVTRALIAARAGARVFHIGPERDLAL